ncbi:ATP-dependent RNA helicase dbp2, partial [Stegodyphus mimosarum]
MLQTCRFRICSNSLDITRFTQAFGKLLSVEKFRGCSTYEHFGEKSNSLDNRDRRISNQEYFEDERYDKPLGFIRKPGSMYNKRKRSYEQEYRQDESYDRPFHERPKFKDQRYERRSYLRSHPTDSAYRDKQHGFNERNFYDSQNNGKTFRFSSDPNHTFSYIAKPKFDLQNLPPVEKYFYNEHPDVADRSEEEVEKYRKELNISVQGKNVPKPITKFLK